MVPVFSASCNKMIEQWKKPVSNEGSCEVDIWPAFQILTGDIISKTAFGSNYEGKKIFELQKELALLVFEAMRTLHIPGFRCI